MHEDKHGEADGGNRVAGSLPQDGLAVAGGIAPVWTGAGTAGAAMDGEFSGGAGVTSGDQEMAADGSSGAQGPVTPGGAGRSRHRKSKGTSWWVEVPVLLVFALVLALIIKTFVIQAFFIPSSSMENTLQIRDKVLVNKLVYDFRPIHRGDIVVFNGEGSWDPAPAQTPPPLVRLWDSIIGLFGTAPGVHDYVKRVIGIPGDHVACCDVQGRVTVNGVPLSEKPYLYPGDEPSTTSFSITVPPGHLWVMGDHRSVSYDSRDHRQDPGGGAIPQDRVVGRAFVIVAPISHWRLLPIPVTFSQAGLTAAHATATGTAFADLAGSAFPLGLGLAGAVPLTWLQSRLRRRLAGTPGRLRGSSGCPPSSRHLGRSGRSGPG